VKKVPADSEKSAGSHLYSVMVLTQYSSVPGSEKLRPGEELWQIAGQPTFVPISIADPPAPKKPFEQVMADCLADAKAKKSPKEETQAKRPVRHCGAA
jgi:hypothetical protein